MLNRLLNYYRVWRRRGAAKVDHKLWIFWVMTGKYPRP